MKTISKEQESRAAGIHARAVDKMHAAGWTLIRQFSAFGAAKTGESFEVWLRGGKTALLHFYAEAGGVELYLQSPGNSWEAFEKAVASAATDAANEPYVRSGDSAALA